MDELNRLSDWIKQIRGEIIVTNNDGVCVWAQEEILQAYDFLSLARRAFEKAKLHQTAAIANQRRPRNDH